MRIEIKEQSANRNICYFTIIKHLKSNLLFKESKILLYHSYFQPVITYACDIWSSAKNNSRKKGKHYEPYTDQSLTRKYRHLKEEVMKL